MFPLLVVINVQIHLCAQVFNDYMDKDTVLLLAGRASRLENRDAIDAAIVSMLADPREVHIFSLYCHLLISFYSYKKGCCLFL